MGERRRSGCRGVGLDGLMARTKGETAALGVSSPKYSQHKDEKQWYSVEVSTRSRIGECKGSGSGVWRDATVAHVAH